MRRASAPAGPGSATRRTAAAAVGEEGLDGGELEVEAGGRLVDPLRGHRDAREPPEHRAQRAGGLPLGRQQAAQDAAQFLGQGEEGERARGGGKVDDEEVVVVLGGGGVPQGAQHGEFLGAGKGAGLLGRQTGGAEQVERTARALLQRGEVGAEPRVGIDPPHGEPGHVRVPEHRPQGVPGSVPTSSVRAPSRAAANAVAAATVVRPLPPGPVIRRVRMRLNATGRPGAPYAPAPGRGRGGGRRT